MQRLTLTFAFALLCACGTSGSTSGQATPSSTALSCTASGNASPSWPAPQSASASTPAIASVVVSGDTVRVTFAAGTPQFQVEPTTSAHFTTDPGGQLIVLAGTAGVKVVLRGFRGDVQNYRGHTSFTSTGPLLLQVSEVGDFEGVVTFAMGLSKAGCANVTASGSTLTFQLIPSP